MKIEQESIISSSLEYAVHSLAVIVDDMIPIFFFHSFFVVNPNKVVIEQWGRRDLF
jgi:hypothetical protein